MPASATSIIDRALGIHDDALMFRSARSRVLASNLANADTPNFKARDLDFQQVLKNQAGAADAGVGLRKTHARHIGVGGQYSQGDLLYRNPYQPTLDGNTVEAEVEQSKFARNAVEYQVSLMLLGRKFSGIRTALKGGQ